MVFFHFHQFNFYNNTYLPVVYISTGILRQLVIWREARMVLIKRLDFLPDCTDSLSYYLSAYHF